jgi:hypothetical protein
VYKKPWAGNGALAARKTYGFSAVRNDTLWPVGEYPVTGECAGVVDFLRDDLEKTATDFRAVRKCAGTTSKAAKDAIKKVYDWTGIWALTTAGLAGGLGYACRSYPGNEYSWLKGALASAALGSAAKLYRHAERKWKLDRNLKLWDENRKSDAKAGYLRLMKEVAASDLRPNEKINARYLMRADQFVRNLSDGSYETEELEKDLETMETCLERYMETMKCDRQTRAEIAQEEAKVA